MSKQPTVLIVEDHNGIVDALRLVLEDEGYHVEVWTHEAMVRPLSEPLPDLILLDLLLGGMDGKTLCQQFKQTPATSHIPVILMSANKHIARIATEVGADAWLLKPFAMEAIFTLLEHYGRKDRR
jgi:DNA-binding response OmpR family regulator